MWRFSIGPWEKAEPSQSDRDYLLQGYAVRGNVGFQYRWNTKTTQSKSGSVEASEESCLRGNYHG